MMKAVCCAWRCFVVQLSQGAVSLNAMGPAVSEHDPYAEFAEDTGKRPDINAGRDLNIAAVFPAVASETLGGTFGIQTSVLFMHMKLVPTICLCAEIVSRGTLGLCCYQATSTKISKSKGVLIN